MQNSDPAPSTDSSDPIDPTDSRDDRGDRRRWIIASALAGILLLGILLLTRLWLPLPRYEPDPALTVEASPLTPEEYALLRPHEEPYVVNVRGDSGRVLLFGSRHTRDTDDPQLDTLAARWRRLDPTVLLVESRLGVFVEGLGDPVETFGEMGYAYGLARRDEVRAYSWEPPREAVLAGTLERFSAERTALFFVLRPYFGARSNGPVDDPEAFVEDVREDRMEWPGLEGTLPDVAAIDSIWRREFPEGPDWREVAYRTGLPGFLDAVHHRVNAARDAHLLRSIVDLVRRGHRVFGVAGSSHAAMLERALLRALAPGDSVLVRETTYSNERFRAVRVERLAARTFHVQGEARVFEGTVQYAIEDGHYRLTSGYTTASEGAPDWGRFEFVFSYEPGPHGAQTQPTLILYEESMRTGAPTHELVVPLERVMR